jgi:hypothetical protein
MFPRWIAAICLAVCFGLTPVALSQSQTNALPWLHTDGKWIKNPAGEALTLVGVNLPLVNLNWATNFEARVKRLQELCNNRATIVRLAVSPEIFFTNAAAYLSQTLDPAVAVCAKYNLYCIIMFHYSSDLSPELKTDVKRFWTMVAPRYAHQSHVWYDLINEPIEPIDWQQWKEWSIPLIQFLRQSAPRTMIVVGAPLWCTDLRGAASDPLFIDSSGLGDFNIVYAAHIYPYHPHNPGPDPKQSSQPNPVFWQERFGHACDVLPVMITEYGWQLHNPCPSEILGTEDGWGEPFKRFVNSKKNVGWLAWVFDDQWSPKMLDEDGNLLDEPQFMGKWVMDWIKEPRFNETTTAKTAPPR